MLSLELWKTIDEFPNYEVSNLGNVRRKSSNMKGGKIPSGHLTVALSKKGSKPSSQYMHRLVAMAFIDNPDNKPLVNHINGNPSDNRLENLEWATYSENNLHGYRSNHRRAPSEQKVMAIDEFGEVVMSFRSGSDAAKIMNVTTGAIWSAVRRKGICSGYRWVKYENN